MVLFSPFGPQWSRETMPDILFLVESLLNSDPFRGYAAKGALFLFREQLFDQITPNFQVLYSGCSSLPLQNVILIRDPQAKIQIQARDLILVSLDRAC